MRVKLRYEEIPFSKGLFVVRFDIYHDEQSQEYAEEIYTEMNINLEEQYRSMGKLW